MAPEGWEAYSKTLRDPETGNWTRVRKVIEDNGSAADRFLERVRERALELPALPPRPKALPGSAKLLNLYHYHDFHLGMLAWHREGGADYDLKIAQKLFRDTLALGIVRAPRASVGVLALNGDFFHANGIEPVTPRSKHVLDVDGRWQKVLEAGADLVIEAIDTLLGYHDRVIFVAPDGNHDGDALTAMRVFIKRLYRKEPRVEVDDSPSPYVAVEFGKNMLAFHHGHLKKNAELTEVFCSGQFREMWGRTTHCQIYTGHRHHRDREKGGAANITQHSTYAARDANASRGGYVSDREGSVVTFHIGGGIWNEAFIRPELLEAA